MAACRNLIWIRKWFYRNSRRNTLVSVLVTLVLVLITWRTIVLDCRAIKTYKPVACLRYKGTMGNQMFSYAFHHFFAKRKGFKMMKVGSFDLHDIFVLENDNFFKDEIFDPSHCECLPTLKGIDGCGIDKELERLSKGKGVFLDGYFQSWRYFMNETTAIKKLFTIKEEIRSKVTKKLQKILQASNWNYKTDKIVGIQIHVPKGDITDKESMNFGKNVPQLKYFLKSMRHMTKIFKRVTFLVCSNDIHWCRERLGSFSNILFADDNTQAEDMAMLTMTNHTILSTGMLGWWAAFLSDGTTIYFKDVFISNSKFTGELRNNLVEDFFPRSWIGIN